MNSGQIKIIALSAVVAISGCATVSDWEPLVDHIGSSGHAYQTDLRECRQLANRVPGAGGSAAGGAVAGALVGAALMAIVGGNSDWALQGAGAGALGGGVGGASQGASDQKQVIRNCMTGRGYRVLN